MAVSMKMCSFVDVRAVYVDEYIFFFSLSDDGGRSTLHHTDNH